MSTPHDHESNHESNHQSKPTSAPTNDHDGNHDGSPDGKLGGEDDYPAQVRRKAERMSRARQQRDAAWRHLVHVGVLGWVFVLPVVAGVAAGRLLARVTGVRALALVGLLVGLALGGFAAWREIRHSMTEEDHT